jgi:D-alanyl-D-alanine carboxypeptidase
MSSTQSIEHNVNVPPELEHRLEELLHELTNQPGIHHAIIAVERTDQSFRWIGAAGEAHPDGTPMTPESTYWIASVTKLYIASAVFKLIEQDEFSLRDPITSLLPAGMLAEIHRIDGTDYTDMITVQHLLGHSSGLPDFLEESPEGELPLLERVAEQDESWTFDDIVTMLREKLTPYFPPQPLDRSSQRIRYSDTNYQILMQLLEQRAGKPISQIFSEFFYEPLGLQHTAHPEILPETQRAASIWFDETPVVIPNAMRCFRDLASTAPDQLRFMRGLVNDEVFDRPVTLHQMMGNWNRFGFPLSLKPPTSPGWPIQYGLGTMRFKVPRLLTPFMSFPTFMGHTGVSGTWLFYCPDLDLVLAGGVSQMAAAAVPFRFVPKLLQTLTKVGLPS